MADYQFNPEIARDRLVAKIRDFVHGAGLSRVVLGISGGKDSTVASALCARALGWENVYGVMMPDGVQK
ncbi:MAG: NAD(+) synthase, partial [Eubacteriales bacterium]